MKPCIFIHTNRKQLLGALVSAHSLRRNSADPECFDVKLLRHEDHQAFFDAYHGRRYLRDGSWRTWRNDDLQSFTPLRFAPPEVMGYRGRAVVIDPDIFAVGDVRELLEREMGGHAILCRRRNGWKKATTWASSVMLLDCDKLGHWRWQQDFDELFQGRRDYADWIGLRLEPQQPGLLEDEWNDFDRLTPKTRLLHNTRRWTQPWKTGLPVDFVPGDRATGIAPVDWLMRKRREWLGEHALLGRYVRHPDRNQERFFFGLLRECVEQGEISPDLLREEIAQGNVRRDAFELLERAPAPAAA